jgi:hypothetical protein
MLGFPGKPQVLRWKAFSPGSTAPLDSCLPVDPGQLAFLIKSKI